MGKPKLRNSIKALHQALFNFIPPGPKTMTWVCIQQAKTHSFREIDCSSFNSIICSSSPSSSSTCTDICSLSEETEQFLPNKKHSIQQLTSEETPSASSSSSIESSEICPVVDSVPKGSISSKRFFFSPCTTNSIMEGADLVLEAKGEVGPDKNVLSGDLWDETEEARERLIMEVGFCKDSVTMALASTNPYMDFKLSMEEMVQAHGLREWSCLQELLNCYLRLNDRTTHKIIIWAFVDLLMNLMTEENNNHSNDSDHNKERCFPIPSPFCLDS